MKVYGDDCNGRPGGSQTAHGCGHFGRGAGGSLSEGSTARRTRRMFSPMMRRISSSSKSALRNASVIWAIPLASKGVVTVPSKSEPRATCSTPTRSAV